MKSRNLSTLIVGFVFFTLLSGFRGCHVSGEVAGPVHGHGHAPAGPVYVDTTPTQVVYAGDVALTVYAPPMSLLTPDTYSFNITVRESGAFGAIVLQGFDYRFDPYGVGVIDIGALPYGFYDIEVVGLDMFGSSVSYAAQGLVVDESLVILTLDLDAVTFSGDVMLDIVEPDSGLYGGPINEIDYILWEIDPSTNELILVEQWFGIYFDPWNPLVIGSLGLGDYYIEVLARDMFGNAIYEFSGTFAHVGEATFLPVPLWYY
jgi:hypothetical protein